MRLPDFFNWTPEERRAILAILLFTGGGGLVVELLRRYPPGVTDLRVPGLVEAADSTGEAVGSPDSSSRMSVMGLGPAGGATPAPAGDSAAAGRTGRHRSDRPETPAGPVNLNGAGVERLADLPGIGPKLAERIVADRRSRGPFRRVEDLDRVKGIGPALLGRLRPLVRVGPAGPDSARTQGP